MPLSVDRRPPDRRRSLVLALMAAAGLSLRPRAAGAQAAEVRLGGTGAGVGPLPLLLDGVPGVRIVPNLGTGGGLKAVAAGAIDVALAARPLQDAERQQGLVSQLLALTPFVFAVHAAVPLRQATLQELAAWYAGRTERWPDGTPVRLVLRPERDADSDFVRSLGPAMAGALAAATARPGAYVAVTDSDASQALDRIAGGLGVTTLGLLKSESRRARPLALDGHTPSVEALVRGQYPHVKSIQLVTRGTPGPAVQAVIDRLTAPTLASRWAALGYQLRPAT